MIARRGAKGRAEPLDALIGQQIRRHRTLAGWTQADLARALDVTVQQVKKYEDGDNRISAANLKKIADSIGTPIAEFYEEPGAAIAGIGPRKREALNLMRLYNEMPVEARRHIVGLAKILAASR